MRSIVTVAYGLCLGLAPSGWSAAAELEVVQGQPAWKLASDTVELAVTEVGGHMAPVTFERQSPQPVQPYYVSPWQEEGLAPEPPVLGPLRGDFFCMPFGGNAAAFRGEQHPPHGEIAGAKWTLAGESSEAGVHSLTLTFDTHVRPGKVTKVLSLVDGQNVVYSEHTIEGFAGPAPLGHHATLRLPDEDGTFRVQSSPFEFGMTNPTQFSNPQSREYQSLAIGHRFTSLERIPTIWRDGPDVDASLLPARTGFADLLAVFKRSDAEGAPAWMTAINREEDYLWFSLKDAGQLPATVFWIENHGRHASPWNGRNRCLGLEDVRAYFADGLVPSVEANGLTAAGIKTVVELSADQPTRVRYIQGAVRVPDGFDETAGVAFEPGRIVFTSARGLKVAVPVHHRFLQSGELK
jgi:hypothetical protein